MANLKQTLNKALTNKYVLYVVTFLAVTNVLGYLAANNWNSVIFFVLLAFLTQYFSKNMTIILLTAMVGTSILFITNNFGVKITEGMTAKEGAEGDMEEDDEKDEGPGDPDAPKVDDNATMQETMKKLKGQLGSEGIKGLNVDTAALIKQQGELKEMMEGMGPLMNSAKSMMKAIDPKTLSAMTNLVGGLNLGGSK